MSSDEIPCPAWFFELIKLTVTAPNFYHMSGCLVIFKTRQLDCHSNSAVTVTVPVTVEVTVTVTLTLTFTVS